MKTLAIILAVLLTLLSATAYAALTDDWLINFAAYDQNGGMSNGALIVGCMAGASNGLDSMDDSSFWRYPGSNGIVIRSWQGSTPLGFDVQAPMVSSSESRSWNITISGDVRAVATGYKLTMWTEYSPSSHSSFQLYSVNPTNLARTLVWSGSGGYIPLEETLVWSSSRFAAGSKPVYNFQLVTGAMDSPPPIIPPVIFPSPEPSSILSLAAGLGGMGLLIRKRI